MRKKNVRANAGASLRRQNNKTARAQARPQWKLETLEPKLLLSADLPGVQHIEGAIDQPGEQDVYELVLTERTRLLFDGLEGDQIQWQLASAQASFDSRDLTRTGDRFLDLVPGSYRLTVDGQQDRTGAYAFRLIGEQSAIPLQANQAASGWLEPGTQADLYAIEVQGRRSPELSSAGSMAGLASQTWPISRRYGRCTTASRPRPSTARQF
jgi:hypothetical protein